MYRYVREVRRKGDPVTRPRPVDHATHVEVARPTHQPEENLNLDLGFSGLGACRAGGGKAGGHEPGHPFLNGIKIV